jgi:hypothetical protein
MIIAISINETGYASHETAPAGPVASASSILHFGILPSALPVRCSRRNPKRAP